MQHGGSVARDKSESNEPLTAASKMSQDALSEHLRSGGNTFDPRTGSSLSGTRNIAVGIAPEHATVYNRPPTAQEHDNFVAAHQDILAKHIHSAVRTSHDPETGQHKMEIVGLTPSKAVAAELGAHLGETHVHNLATGEKIATGVSGDQSPSHVPIDARFDHLRQSSPSKESYSGTHFSDRKLDKIEGSRRGEASAGKLPATNADSARVHLGTKTGKGVDAPAGFYTVKAGASAPALAAAKAHSHSVRGNFAFATTEHPAFKEGYANGVQHASLSGADPQTAHQFGLNAAEHALEDAGFDGYHSATHSHIRFHFGDHEIAPAHDHPKPEDTKPQVVSAAK